MRPRGEAAGAEGKLEDDDDVAEDSAAEAMTDEDDAAMRIRPEGAEAEGRVAEETTPTRAPPAAVGAITRAEAGAPA